MDDKSTISNLLKIIYHQQQQLNVMHELIQKQYEPSVINQPQNSIPQSIITDPQNQTINPIPRPTTPLPATSMQQRPSLPIIQTQPKVVIFNKEQSSELRNIDYTCHSLAMLKERRSDARKRLDAFAYQEALSPSSNYTKRQRKATSRDTLLSQMLDQRDKSPQPQEPSINPSVDQDNKYPKSHSQKSSINWDELEARMTPLISKESESHQSDPQTSNLESSPVN